MNKIWLLLFIGIFFMGCEPKEITQQPKVKTGAEVLLDKHLEELQGKRIGLMMNSTSRVNGVHMLDTLLNLDVNVTALFAAEHGFRGGAGAGEIIEDGIDQETGLPVHSLYGSTKKPTAEMLSNVDLLLFDLPDMGVRFFTYNSTLGKVMEAAAEHGKELWILDRPNPLGGNYVAGWILEDEFKSFVGSYPLPAIYGLTMGEIARMAEGEGWLDLEQELKYRVIKIEGWHRDMLWPETGLEWRAPSPNLPTFEHAFIYPGTVIFEGTNLSEGRGTKDPFLIIGSPNFNVKTEALVKIETKHHVQLDTLSFQPKSIPGVALKPKWEGEQCHGIKISLKGSYADTDPFKLGLDLLLLAKNHTADFKIKPFANLLYGIDLKTIIENGDDIPSWKEEVEAFKEYRMPYLLYD
jgi:uncharacterized protein YbbC (DUF1343 family)